MHSSEIEVELKPGEGRPKEALVADIRQRLAVLPVSVNVGQPISHRLDHMLSGVRAEIVLKIYGEDLDALRRIANSLRERFASIPGLTDLQVEKQVRIPQLEIRVDYTRAALYGVQPAAVVEAALTPRQPQAVAALDVFCALLGTVAGNLALTLGARGGVYIGGGIVPRLGTRFDASAFRARFEGKGRYADYLRPIPVWVITAPESPALMGAARSLDGLD